MYTRSALFGLGLILSLVGGIAGAGAYKRARLRVEYVAQAQREQRADSLRRALSRRFPMMTPRFQLPPCGIHGEPVDHMPIASGGLHVERMPVAAKSCDDTLRDQPHSPTLEQP